MSTTTTTTRDRAIYGPMEWAQRWQSAASPTAVALTTYLAYGIRRILWSDHLSKGSSRLARVFAIVQASALYIHTYPNSIKHYPWLWQYQRGLTADRLNNDRHGRRRRARSTRATVRVRTASVATTRVKLAVWVNEETTVTETTRREVPVNSYRQQSAAQAEKWHSRTRWCSDRLTYRVKQNHFYKWHSQTFWLTGSRSVSLFFKKNFLATSNIHSANVCSVLCVHSVTMTA